MTREEQYYNETGLRSKIRIKIVDRQDDKVKEVEAYHKDYVKDLESKLEASEGLKGNVEEMFSDMHKATTPRERHNAFIRWGEYLNHLKEKG